MAPVPQLLSDRDPKLRIPCLVDRPTKTCSRTCTTSLTECFSGNRTRELICKMTAMEPRQRTLLLSEAPSAEIGL